MVEPKPLFEDEPPTVAPLVLPDEPARVLALDLRDDPLPGAAPPERQPAVAQIGIGEHPHVANAMQRGVSLFPELMRDRGYLVRNRLAELIPVDFTKLSNFAADTLARCAALVGQVADLNRDCHQIDAENLIGGIVERARTHANAGTSMMRLLGGLLPFDEGAAVMQIGAIRQAVQATLPRIAAASGDMARVADALTVEAAVLAILNDMGDHGPAGDLLARRAYLVGAARQEIDMAIRQAETLIAQAQQWVMRCDEVRGVVLPALGFNARASGAG